MKIRIDLVGQIEGALQRISEDIKNILDKVVDNTSFTDDPEVVQRRKERASDIVDLFKSFGSAKLSKPGILNEQTIADINEKFERAKKIAAERHKLEVETDILKVRLREERQDALIRQLTSKLKLLGFLHQFVTIDDDGNINLVMTNDDISRFLDRSRTSDSGISL